MVKLVNTKVCRQTQKWATDPVIKNSNFYVPR